MKIWSGKRHENAARYSRAAWKRLFKTINQRSSQRKHIDVWTQFSVSDQREILTNTLFNFKHVLLVLYDIRLLIDRIRSFYVRTMYRNHIAN